MDRDAPDDSTEKDSVLQVLRRLSWTRSRPPLSRGCKDGRGMTRPSMPARAADAGFVRDQIADPCGGLSSGTRAARPCCLFFEGISATSEAEAITIANRQCRAGGQPAIRFGADVEPSDSLAKSAAKNSMAVCHGRSPRQRQNRMRGVCERHGKRNRRRDASNLAGSEPRGLPCGRRSAPTPRQAIPSPRRPRRQ